MPLDLRASDPDSRHRQPARAALLGSRHRSWRFYV